MYRDRSLTFEFQPIALSFIPTEHLALLKSFLDIPDLAAIIQKIMLDIRNHHLLPSASSFEYVLAWAEESDRLPLIDFVLMYLLLEASKRLGVRLSTATFVCESDNSKGAMIAASGILSFREVGKAISEGRLGNILASHNLFSLSDSQNEVKHAKSITKAVAAIKSVYFDPNMHHSEISSWLLLLSASELTSQISGKISNNCLHPLGVRFAEKMYRWATITRNDGVFNATSLSSFYF